MNPAAQGYVNNQRQIPRVIRDAMDAAQRQPLPAGYSPALAVQMARSHRWPPYDAVAAALRSLAQGGLVQRTARESARATIQELFQHPTPFDANVRFPEGQLYLCVDQGKFGQAMYRIQKELLRVEAAADNYSWRIIQACEAFMEAVCVAAANGTLKWQDDFGEPVMYNRAIFEEAFHLTWTDYAE